MIHLSGKEGGLESGLLLATRVGRFENVGWMGNPMVMVTGEEASFCALGRRSFRKVVLLMSYNGSLD